MLILAIILVFVALAYRQPDMAINICVAGFIGQVMIFNTTKQSIDAWQIPALFVFTLMLAFVCRRRLQSP